LVITAVGVTSTVEDGNVVDLLHENDSVPEVEMD
jgi:hypothetical protein